MKRNIKLVGVGASAGGLDALIEFFKNVPADCEAAFLVIQHVSPDHESIMDQLLAPHVQLPIEKAQSGMQLQKGTIYLSTPGMIARVNGMVLHLEARPENQAITLPIDLLFLSMAHTLGTEAAVVVLSGTGSDGTKGSVDVARNGGLVAVQLPESAEFNGMPRSAIWNGCPDVIAPAAEIWQLLLKAACDDSTNAMLGADASRELLEDSQQELFDEELYRALFEYLDKRFGLNFSLYRINSVSRRLKRRMDLLSISEIQQYLDYIQVNEDETLRLYKDLLIGLTEFFRNKESLQALAEKGLKNRMIQEPDRDLRIWVAGCATGEEAYSTYIVADEMRQETNFRGKITVFATDVFKPSIEHAGRGVYTAGELAGLSEARMQRYFQQVDTALFKIQPRVRENIIFAHHNFLLDAPFTNIDVVSCRNVLIYMKGDTQQVALRAFAYALRNDGILFVGNSESLGALETSFQAISAKHKLFQQHGKSSASERWPLGHGTFSPKASDFFQASSRASVTINRQLLNAYDSLLERFGPSGFLVNAEREVLHCFGNASDYCVHVSGRARSDLAEQFDKRLKQAVIALMYRCSHNQARVDSKGIRCQSSSGECLVDVAVETLKRHDGAGPCFFIEIHRRSEIPAEKPGLPSTSIGAFSDEVEDADSTTRIKALEDELRFTRENLEAANEELQVSNEELQAINEEMQVANEELQSANEELHSVNQELITLNAEYERTNEELITVNTSHLNLLESTEDGVLFVDRDMRIRQFNTAIKKAFNLVHSDVGRPLHQIAYRMEGNEPLYDEVRRVLNNGARVAVQTELANGLIYLKRIVPFRGSSGEIDGALLTFTDITQEVRLEKRFLFALKTAKLSWWDYDVPRGMVMLQSAGECFLGADCIPSDHNRDSWMQQVHPDDRSIVEQSLNACLTGETDEWNCEHRFRTSSGDWLWVSNQGMVMRRSPKGEPLEMIGTTRDINDFKLALLCATSQRDMLNVVGDIALMGYWSYDVETRQVEWSAQTRKILAVGDDFDPSVEGTFEFIPSPDRERLQAAFQKAVDKGVPYDLELQCVDRNGRHCFVRSSGRPHVDEGGRVVRVVGVFQDVTETMRTQHEVSAFFAVSPDFQATATFEGVLKTFNGSWETQLGYPANELLEMTLSDFVVAEERVAFEEKLKLVIAGESVSNYETRVMSRAAQLPCEGESESWLSWSMSSDPHLRFIVVSARCVTEQKKAVKDLQLARIRAEEANRAKTDFLAVMSHELRTPLNPILGYTDMLIEDTQDEEQLEILKTIVQSGDQMLALIDELLEYSKIDAGKSEVEVVDFYLSDLVAEKVRLMKGMLKGVDCELTHSIDWGNFNPESEPVMLGDIGMLRQILRNLIANAIKFTNQGSIDFHTRVLKASAGEALLEFAVADTGIGIAEADITGLFEPFTQVDRGMTRKYGGTGLGLAICKRLVDLLGGRIDVQSELGKGSVFTVQVPLRYGMDEGDVVKQSGNPEGSPNKKPPLIGGVLVVDDHASNALYIRKLVELRGLEVDVAHSGEDALKLSSTKRFQLIFLDLHMPGLDGFETLSQIRQHEAGVDAPPVPVVILTADASQEARQSSVEAGAEDLLVKPVKPASINEMLSKYLKTG
jgi:two-component system CheB/CheR fusion protein